MSVAHFWAAPARMETILKEDVVRTKCRLNGESNLKSPKSKAVANQSHPFSEIDFGKASRANRIHLSLLASCSVLYLTNFMNNPRTWWSPLRNICARGELLTSSPQYYHRTSFRMASGSTPIITLSSLTILQPTALAPVLLDPTERHKVAIIDVRDSDHIGGNITGSQWVPVNQLDVRMPELIRTLKDKERVIFHCMLSQQRGPKAALAYARAKHRAEQKEATEKANSNSDGTRDKTSSSKQEVCVLEGGFGSWQARYGEDSRLTADYVPDIWD